MNPKKAVITVALTVLSVIVATIIIQKTGIVNRV